MTLAWTSSPVWLVINALMAFRLTRLWVDDELPPLPVFRRWARHRLDLASSRSSKRTEHISLYGGHPLENLIGCTWCAGYWISLAVFLAASLIPLTVWAFLAVPLALSAVVGLLAART